MWAATTPGDCQLFVPPNANATTVVLVEVGGAGGAGGNAHQGSGSSGQRSNITWVSGTDQLENQLLTANGGAGGKAGDQQPAAGAVHASGQVHAEANVNEKRVLHAYVLQGRGAAGGNPGVHLGAANGDPYAGSPAANGGLAVAVVQLFPGEVLRACVGRPGAPSTGGVAGARGSPGAPGFATVRVLATLPPPPQTTTTTTPTTTPTSTPTSTPTTTPCVPRFVGHATPQLWQAAETICQQEGGHLASIHNAQENALVNSAVGGQKWTGGRLAVRGNAGSLKWLDDSPVDYSNFAVNEPNNDDGTDECISMFPDGKWNDNKCSQDRPASLPFVCRIDCP